MNKYLMLKAIKIGLGSSIAVLLASLLGLQYATTAGVVTLLTIRNTKKDTVELASKRLLSYVVSIGVIIITFRVIDDNSIGFGIFITCLVLFSGYFKWDESISINAVIGTHIFLMEEQLTLVFLANELGLVVIGTGVAIIINLYMIDNINEIREDTKYIEKELQSILLDMSHHIRNTKRLDEDKTHIVDLIHYIDRATDKAFENIKNTSNDLAQYYVEYLNMRKGQCVVLLHLYRTMLGIQTECVELEEVAEIIQEISNAIHKTAGVRLIIAELEEVVTKLKLETLPSTSEEFIAKAQIFYILEELEEILRLKREFLKTLTPQEIKLYWGD